MSTDGDDDFWENVEADLDEAEVQTAIAEAGDDLVVCRDCARAFGQITEQHLDTHDKTLGEYQRDHPDAPIRPDAPERQPGREEGYEHSEETKRRISESMAGEGDA